MPEYQATIRPVREVEDLEVSWRRLEAQSERSFFLGWDWAATTIEVSGDSLLVAEIKSSQGVVALGLLVPVTEVRHGVMSFSQLCLNETGPDPARSVLIEYNTLLAAPEVEAPAWEALLQALDVAGAPHWDEIVVKNATIDLETSLKAIGLNIYRRAISGSAYVDLADLRARGVDTVEGYCAGLGGSTCRQIARSIKLYEERGVLTVDRAMTPEEGCSYLNEIQKLHKAKWHTRGTYNEASTEYLYAFHRKLVSRTIERGGVELARISAGGEPFAWVYNFVDRGQVLFNSGGFIVESDNRLKPGLVAHALLIAAHIKAGRDIYDFLAGDDRYKLNLGQPGPTFVSFVIQRLTLSLRIEGALRRVKHSLAGAQGLKSTYQSTQNCSNKPSHFLPSTTGGQII